MEESERARLEMRVARLEQQIGAFKELHASELGLILGELAALRADLAPRPAPDQAQAPQTNDAAGAADPAASSPKRAAWLAEQERKERERREPISRRELLRGRERDGEGA